jgi:membrane protein required for colicin V production
MNPLDLGVIAIVALSAIFAFARGFVREALSIVAWVGAGAVTLYGFNWVYVQVEPRVHDRLLSQVITGFGLFVGSLIVLTILTGMIARTVRDSGLSPIDRTLGFIFGLARAAFLLCAGYLALDLTLPQQSDRPEWIRDAKSGPYLHEGADVLRDLSDRFLPQAWKIKSAAAVDDTMKALSPAVEADKAMRALANPAPAAAAKPESAAEPGYRQGDQRGLDRLIGTQR